MCSFYTYSDNNSPHDSFYKRLAVFYFVIIGDKVGAEQGLNLLKMFLGVVRFDTVAVATSLCYLL